MNVEWPLRHGEEGLTLMTRRQHKLVNIITTQAVLLPNNWGINSYEQIVIDHSPAQPLHANA